MEQVKTALSALTLGEPAVHGALRVFPLTTVAPSGLSYLLLEEALKQDLVQVGEVSEGGSVPDLKVENRAPQPVLIVDGEELVGAKQNRVANLTMMIPPDTTTVIPVSCVEAGRWGYGGPDPDSPRRGGGPPGAMRVSDRVQEPEGRALRLESVQYSMRRRRGARRSDQGAVWAQLDEAAAELDADSPTMAMGAMYERHQRKLDGYVGAVKPAVDQVGAVFAVAGRRWGLDLFDQPPTLAAFLPKLVRSYAVDALRAVGDPEAADHGGSVRGFLDRIAAGSFDEHAAVGMGRDVGFVGKGLVAGALVVGGTVAHLTAFAEEGQEGESDPAASPEGPRYSSYRQRRKSMRDRYER